MVVTDFFFVLLFALLLSSLLGWGFGWRHPARNNGIGTSVLFLFLILMFTMWAGGVWLPPWGPQWHGTSWLNLLLVGILVSLLVLAIARPIRPPRTKHEALEQAEEAVVVGTVFGFFFWLLALGLVIAVMLRYIL